jgi:hypothetical protein
VAVEITGICNNPQRRGKNQAFTTKVLTKQQALDMKPVDLLKWGFRMKVNATQNFGFWCWWWKPGREVCQRSLA